MRLIVSVPVDTVAEVDRLIAADGGRLCRAEFVRQAIAEKLDLMISRGAGGDSALDAVRGPNGGASEVATHMQPLEESRT
jgi:hypothetical protein